MIEDGAAVTAIHEATTVYRKGPEVEQRSVGGLHVTEVWSYPPTSAAPPDAEKHDLFFVDIVVHKDVAAESAAVIREWLDQDPERAHIVSQGPSYIHMGQWIEQETALRLFAIGESLGWWKVFSPTNLGMTGEAARQLAGGGFVYATPVTQTEGAPT